MLMYPSTEFRVKIAIDPMANRVTDVAFIVVVAPGSRVVGGCHPLDPGHKT